MNKIKILIPLAFLLYLSNRTCAQTLAIDSLKKVLQTQIEDTNKVHTLQQLAKKLSGTGEFQIALTVGNQSLELSKKLNFKEGQGDAYLVLGVISTSLNDYPSAFRFLDSCVMVRQRLDDKAGMAEAYIYLAEVYHLQDKYAESLRQLVKAEKIYDQLKDSSALTDLYSYYGSIYIDYGHTDEAIDYLLKALNAYRANDQLPPLSRNLSIITMAYLYKGNLRQALASINEAIAIRSKLATNYDPMNSLYLAKVYVEISENLQRQGKYGMAMDTCNLALKEMARPLQIFEKENHYSGKVNSYITLGRIYLGLNEFNQANYYLQKCLALSLQTKNLFEARDSYLYLSKMYTKTGKLNAAFENYKTYIAFRDSIVNQTSSSQIAQIRMEYALEKEEAIAKAVQEKKDAIASKELESEKRIRNSFIGGFVAMLVFATVFFSQRNKIKKGKKRSDELLLNILPSEVAEELKQTGRTEARHFDDVTVMFTDFKNFTKISERLSPVELVNEIDTCFKAFDNIVSKYNIEKIKTIGDSYMCAGGLSHTNNTNANDVVGAALEIRQFIEDYCKQRIREGKDPFEIRIGIHTGPVVAGIVGVKKFAYDIWGDTVNIASRMESSGEVQKINISGATYHLVKHQFHCTYRGKIEAKNKGETDMYFVEPVKH